MGVDAKSSTAPPLPLPAPTETESTSLTPTELATDVSRPADEKSSYSLPDDGTPVTIKTRGHRSNRSQTSLLIEYFEGGKPSSGGSKSAEQRKPSVRVRLTPSRKSRSGKGGSPAEQRDHILITETKVRKASLSRRRSGTPVSPGSATPRGDVENRNSNNHDSNPNMDDASPYASATEESNVSRNPIDIEIDRSGSGHPVVRRSRRPTSPLIPAADTASSYPLPPAAPSDMSSLPACSFLDGSGPTGSSSVKTTSDAAKNGGSGSRRSRSPSGRDVLAGATAAAAAGLATAAAADKLRTKSRDREKDRISVSKTRDKDRSSSDRKAARSGGGGGGGKSSSSRSSSAQNDKERHAKTTATPRKRSGGSGDHHQHESSILTESSVLSSNLSPSYRSADQHSVRSGASKASSINNPKLLETVEDVIKRLILPELNALKREQSRHKSSRRDSAASSTATTTTTNTSLSRDEARGGDGRRSGGRHHATDSARESLKKERRDREARNRLDDSPTPSALSHDSTEESVVRVHDDDHERRGGDRLRAAAVGAAAGGALGAAAAAATMMGKASPSSDDKGTARRRRRAETRSRSSDQLLAAEDDSEAEDGDVAARRTPNLPLMMSDVNPSDVTRTSILSADTDRPRSASEELAPGGAAAPRTPQRDPLLGSSSPTPTGTPITLQTGLGTQHANISHGDLKELPRRRTGDFPGARAAGPPTGYGRADAQYGEEEEDDDDREYDDEHADAYAAPPPGPYDYYNTQDVPPPLRYEPYQPERRGLSPIPSVSGYTEGGSEAAAPNRDSGATRTTGTVSPLSARGGDRHSPSSVPSNVASREFGGGRHGDDEDRRSVRSYGDDDEADFRNAAAGTTYTEDSELDHDAAQQKAVRAVGANPELVHPPPLGLESNVASLVDGSMVDSALTGESLGGGGGGYAVHYNNRDYSTDTLDEGRRGSASVESYRRDHHQQQPQQADGSGRGDTPTSGRSRDFAEEYEVDEYGNKVPRSSARYRQSPTASETAITVPAAIAAAAAIKAAQSRGGSQPQQQEGVGVQRNRSFKERAMDGGLGPRAAVSSSARNTDDYDEPAPKMGYHAMPNPDDPLPEIGNWHDDAESVDDDHHHRRRQDEEAWRQQGDATPRQHTPGPYGPQQQQQQQRAYHDAGHESSGLGTAAAVAGAAAAAAAGAAMAATSGDHSRQPSQEQVEEWHRNSDDRKRDTLVTNPYEGASPIENLPGLNDNLLGAAPPPFGNGEFAGAFVGSGGGGAGGAAGARGGVGEGGVAAARSPLGHKVDEGYISQGPNKTPDRGAGAAAAAGGVAGSQGGVDFTLQPTPGVQEDPFYAPPLPTAQQQQQQTTKGVRHLSGMSHGMSSPFYDAATGAGIERIESKDIIALMQHLMVRDAQRSARDTEILVTLVRAAAEMRNSFEDLKRMLADTEDVIITEVKENTEKTVQRAVIGGPRPYPGGGSSGARSLLAAGGSVGGGSGFDDLPAKKRNLFRRALKGLSAKGTNDLGRIEEMLMQLLTEVDVLKTLQTTTTTTTPGAAASVSHQGGGGPSSSDHLHLQQQQQEHLQQPEMMAATGLYEQDRGYEPEGHAGTSTASHASQSGGHLSIGPASSAAAAAAAGGKLVGGYDRRFSDHRISTVPEAHDEDDYDDYDDVHNHHHHLGYNDGHTDMLMTPAIEPTTHNNNNNSGGGGNQRGNSLTPPRPPPVASNQAASLSQENTPRTDKAKKHKSSSSSGWFPKISRWSETTTSSVAQAFRRSGGGRKNQDDGGGGGRAPPSRSGSDLAAPYDDNDNSPRTDPYGDDKLHTGFSDPNLGARGSPAAGSHHSGRNSPYAAAAATGSPMRRRTPLQHYHSPPPAAYHHVSSAVYGSMTPEDPKYKAHRNSLNLQHPQPRPGQTELFRAALESQAQEFDSPTSPRSADWAGSATSLHRLPRNANRDSYGSATAEQQQQQQQQYWTASSPAPPRPPKEPLDASSRTPPSLTRAQGRGGGAKLQKQSPLPHHSVESGYGTMTQGVPSASYVSHAHTHSRGDEDAHHHPQLENRNLSGALGVPTRRPSGPRAMTPRSGGGGGSEEGDGERRRKRDTFGTITSQDTDTF